MLAQLSRLSRWLATGGRRSASQQTVRARCDQGRPLVRDRPSRQLGPPAQLTAAAITTAAPVLLKVAPKALPKVAPEVVPKVALNFLPVFWPDGVLPTGPMTAIM